MSRQPKGTPTHTNLYVLREHFQDAAKQPLDVAPNRIDSVSSEHMRRCMRAGLFTISDDRQQLLLTAAGKAALGRPA